MGFLTNCRRQIATPLAVAAVVLASALAPTSTLVAQDTLGAKKEAMLSDGTQPVVTMTIGSVNKLMQDVNYLTGVAGQPQFGGIFAMMAGTYAQGMNMDQPIGVLVPMINGTPQPIVMLPTTDIKPILQRLEAQTGPIDELDDGTMIVSPNGQTVYIKQTADHAIACRDAEALKLVPASTAGLFQGMGNQYDVAVRMNVQQVPAEIRNVLIDQMRQGFEGAMQQQQDADSAREVAENSIEQLERLIQEADELNVGLNIDQSKREIAVDLSFSAVGGTQLAAVYGGQQSIPSRFSSVIRQDAAAFVHTASSISPEAIQQATEGIESTMSMVRGAFSSQGNMSEAQLAEVDRYMGQLSTIITDSLAEGKSDMGLMVLAGPEQFQAVLGTFVADGNKVAELAKDLATKVPADNPKAPKFTFDIGNFNGVTMHMVEAAVPPGEDEARKLFGDTIQVHIGTAPKAVYVATGKGSEELLKQFITSGANDAGGDRPLGQFKLRLLPIMKLAQSVESNPGVESMIDALSGAGGLGELTITSKSIPNGAASKVSIGEGLIKALSAAGVAAQRMQQPPPAF